MFRPTVRQMAGRLHPLCSNDPPVPLPPDSPSDSGKRLPFRADEIQLIDLNFCVLMSAFHSTASSSPLLVLLLSLFDFSQRNTIQFFDCLQQLGGGSISGS